MPRALGAPEINGLPSRATVLRLATLDLDGYPHITPLWFVWDGEAIWATSKDGAPHLARMSSVAKVGLLVQVEAPERADGERPNCQFRVVADAQLVPDDDGSRTRSITQKYLRRSSAKRITNTRAGQPRTAIRLVPRSVVAVASV